MERRTGEFGEFEDLLHALVDVAERKRADVFREQLASGASGGAGVRICRVLRHELNGVHDLGVERSRLHYRDLREGR